MIFVVIYVALGFDNAQTLTIDVDPLNTAA